MSARSVQELVRSSIEQKLPDSMIADYLRKIKVLGTLNDGDIEQLRQAGAGPGTVNALMAMRDPSAPPPTGGPLTSRQPPAPTDDEQRDIIHAAREYALNYTKSLPDFICAQITERFTDPTGKENWRKGDTIKSKLSYNGHQENYIVLMVNDRSAIGRDIESFGGTSSTGEFASMLRFIFEEESETEFHWDHLGRWDNRASYVFGYSVDQGQSKWKIEDRETGRSVISGYQGLIYIDRSTGQILHVTLETVDIPADFPIQRATEALSYDYTDIGGTKYLLPVKTEVRLERGLHLSRNDVYFRSYRKFSADAVISFDDPATPYKKP